MYNMRAREQYIYAHRESSLVLTPKGCHPLNTVYIYTRIHVERPDGTDGVRCIRHAAAGSISPRSVRVTYKSVGIVIIIIVNY